MKVCWSALSISSVDTGSSIWLTDHLILNEYYKDFKNTVLKDTHNESSQIQCAVNQFGSFISNNFNVSSCLDFYYQKFSQ